MFYDKEEYKESEEAFLSSLYIETCFLFSSVYPQENQKRIEIRAKNFLQKLLSSESSSTHLNELVQLFENNALSLELVSLLGENPEFACGALSYLLYKVFEKGLSSLKKREFIDLLIGVGNRSLSLWSLSKLEEKATPYSLKIILLAAKHDNEFRKKIPSILSRVNTTLWQSLLFSKNKQAMQIFLLDYGKADCNERGDSALMVAVQEGYGNLVPFLLDNGCDTVGESKNKINLTVLDMLSSLRLKSSEEEVKKVLKIIIEKAFFAQGMTQDFQLKVLTKVVDLHLGLPFCNS